MSLKQSRSDISSKLFIVALPKGREWSAREAPAENAAPPQAGRSKCTAQSLGVYHLPMLSRRGRVVEILILRRWEATYNSVGNVRTQSSIVVVVAAAFLLAD